MYKRQRNRRMSIIYSILSILILTNCTKKHQLNEQVELKTINTTETKNKENHHTEEQLENFLDSIGSLSPLLWSDSIGFKTDYTFKNQQQLNKVISQKDFTKLKRTILEYDETDRVIDVKTAKSIFGEIDSSFLSEDRIPLTFISFDENKDDLNEYAVCLGKLSMNWECVLYFFKGNQIIAKHKNYHRYGLKIEHYIDADNKTVIYYKENFGSGSGVWQFNYYFYKFYDNELVPILNELENSNLNGWGNKRNFWLKTTITNTRPLTLKIVYNQELFDANDISLKIVDDSTFVQYAWDEKKRKLDPYYEKSKINKFQILTYYLANNQLLFINTYYSTLKDCLKDKRKRNIVLNYLNYIKNHLENN